MSYKRYWVALAIVILGSFAVLGSLGRKMISEAPPIPNVYTADGQLLFTGSSITDGQGVWQSVGGQEIGTVWGHGAYVAPDWSADWLHRESLIMLETWAMSSGARNFESLGLEAGPWRAQLWARNLFDKWYWTSAQHVNDVLLHYTGMPRTYGLSFSYRFD